MGQLFQKIEDGRRWAYKFQFSDLAAPYILNTAKLLYVEIKRGYSMIKSKYTMIMLAKLIEAKRFEE